jgi:hypothetical protein
MVIPDIYGVHRSKFLLTSDLLEAQSRLGICILYNWNLFINNGNIMAGPHYLILYFHVTSPLLSTFSSQLSTSTFAKSKYKIYSCIFIYINLIYFA